MATQVFRKLVPKSFLFEFLDKICFKSDKYYLVDYNSYRIFLHKELRDEFVLELENYYHTSKCFYINRKMTYNSYINIIRQICKTNKIQFEPQIKYNKSKYCIELVIYHEGVASGTTESGNLELQKIVGASTASVSAGIHPPSHPPSTEEPI